MSFEQQSDQTSESDGAEDKSADQQAVEQQEPQAVTIGGKEYDLASLAKKIEAQDAFIETLKAEKGEVLETGEKALSELEKVQNQLTTKEGLEALLDQLKRADEAKASEHASVEVPSMDEITEKVAQNLSEKQTLEAQEANMDKALARAREAFGEDNFLSEIEKKGKELGFDLKGVDELARTNPTAFESFFLPKADKPKADTLKGSGIGTNTGQQAHDPKPTSWEALSPKQRQADFKARWAKAAEQFK